MNRKGMNKNIQPSFFNGGCPCVQAWNHNQTHYSITPVHTLRGTILRYFSDLKALVIKMKTFNTLKKKKRSQHQYYVQGVQKVRGS